MCHLMMSYCDVIIQYWRLMIADNYGDPTSCLAEVQFFGVGECKYHTVLHCITLVLSHITFSLVPQVPGSLNTATHCLSKLFSVTSIDHIALPFAQRMTSLTGLRDLS